MPSPITTHVLDTAKGRPAAGMSVTLEVQIESSEWKRMGSGVTNADGRIADLLPETFRLAAGIYRLTFETAGYFRSMGDLTFYPSITVVFEIREPDSHYHVPLLLSPYGYTIYRGS